MSLKLAEKAQRPLRLLVSIAPRHGKSELVSHWFPVWLLTNWPQERLILASYEATFAATWGRKARDSVLQNAELLGIQVREDVSATDAWELTTGGGMVTAGVGGPITGRGGHLVIDDPIKNAEEANSITRRESIWEWWLTTARTRLEPGASIVITMARWHRDDLIGRLLREGAEPWDYISLPALSEAGDILGRGVDTPLWPERFNKEALLATRQAVGESSWKSLYQQHPEEVTGDCYFDINKLGEQLKEAQKGREVFQSYSPMRRYTAWIDAKGTGEDRASLSIVAWHGTQAAFVVDYTTKDSLYNFSLKALSILGQFQNPLVGWERNGVGEGIYQIFKAQGYPAGRIYYQDREKGQHGIAQSANLRQYMLVRLASAIEGNEVLILSWESIQEAMCFVKKPSGSPSAAPGAHDDRVMAMAGAYWLALQAPNLGIRPISKRSNTF